MLSTSQPPSEESESSTTTTSSRKRCSKCRLERPLIQFGKDVSRPSGLQVVCKPCQLAYREANREKIKQGNNERYRVKSELAGVVRQDNRSKLPEHKVWRGIWWRCTTKDPDAYRVYGSRGITVCERWKVFHNFYEDMGPRPTPKHTIERRNTNGNYEPSNCYWATQKVQQRNRRNNRHLTLNGETRVLAAWAEETGIARTTIFQRLRAGWSIERALTTPVR